MNIITEEIEEQVLSLVQQQKKVKINWIASVVLLTEKDVIELASKLEIEVDGEYLIAPKTKEDEAKKKNLTKEEYDRLYPKPAPTFCDAKASRYKN
ncbi:MAG: hypothetical protein ACTSPM_04100 [Candidatus Heimdallarchaeota archaeon]